MILGTLCSLQAESNSSSVGGFLPSWSCFSDRSCIVCAALPRGFCFGAFPGEYRLGCAGQHSICDECPGVPHWKQHPLAAQWQYPTGECIFVASLHRAFARRSCSSGGALGSNGASGVFCGGGCWCAGCWVC